MCFSLKNDLASVPSHFGLLDVAGQLLLVVLPSGQVVQAPVSAAVALLLLLAIPFVVLVVLLEKLGNRVASGIGGKKQMFAHVSKELEGHILTGFFLTFIRKQQDSNDEHKPDSWTNV